MSAESAQTLKYQAALARAEERLAAVTAERDAVTARAEKAEHTLLHSSVSGYLARCVELESALSEAADTGAREAMRAALSAPAVVDPKVEATIKALTEAEEWMSSGDATPTDGWGIRIKSADNERANINAKSRAALAAWGKR